MAPEQPTPSSQSSASSFASFMKEGGERRDGEPATLAGGSISEKIPRTTGDDDIEGQNDAGKTNAKHQPKKQKMRVGYRTDNDDFKELSLQPPKLPPSDHAIRPPGRRSDEDDLKKSASLPSPNHPNNAKRVKENATKNEHILDNSEAKPAGRESLPHNQRSENDKEKLGCSSAEEGNTRGRGATKFGSNVVAQTNERARSKYRGNQDDEDLLEDSEEDDDSPLAIESHAGAFAVGRGAVRARVKNTEAFLLRSSEASIDVNTIVFVNSTQALENGESIQPVVDDNDLAVAIAINEGEKSYAYAVDNDPDSQPSIHRKRRFRLSGIILAITLVVFGVVFSKKDDNSVTVVLTLEPTAAPSAAPTLSREGHYRSFFTENVSPKVMVPGTPHYSASEWIMNEDPMQIELSNPNLLQRYMMAFLWFHTTNNGRTEWRSCNPPKEGEDDTCEFLEFTRLANDSIAYVSRNDKIRWLSGEEECKWVGVECAGGSAVLGFRIFGQNLTGTLPTELVALPFLQRISVAYNQMIGTLPAEYASLKYLLDIEIHGNLFTGTIPAEYFGENVMTLVNFNIGDNAFSGTLDSRIGLMTNLTLLYIDQNNLEGKVPTEIGNLNYLSFIRVNGNEFSGPIPTELGTLGQLSELGFHENVFTGTLPSELGRLSRNQDFQIWGNRLTGKIPEELFNMSKLKRFSVREMALTGTLSTRVGQLTDLEQLEVSTNKLTGPIPSEIQFIASLRLAWLNSNLFTGQVPDEICSLVVRQNGLEFLQADCSPTDYAPNPCSCCSDCCDRDEGICVTNDLI